MDVDVKNQIDKIKGKVECSREFCCLKTGFDKSCKAKDVGVKGYLECLEEDASLCPFSVSYGSAYFCSCPLRVHICKTMGK
jgi:hypothetical protein